MQQIKDLKIYDTAYGGYGVGKDSNGKVILTPYTVEDDIVDVEIIDDKKSFAYAKLIEVKSASPKRVKEVVCKYYNICGGCLFQHIDHSEQLNIKRKIFLNALRKYTDPLPEITEEDSPTIEYRLRTLMQVRNGKVGFYEFRSRNFVAVDICVILSKTLFEKIDKFAKTYNFSGEIYAIETDQNIALASIKSEIDFTIKDTLDFVGVNINGKNYGVDRVNYNTHFGAVRIGHDSFFQSNRFLLDSFQEYSVSLADDHLQTVELYAGSGFFTAGLSKLSSFVAGVESSTAQVALAKANGFKVIKSDVERYLSSDKLSKDIEQIFLDPPRDGVSKTVINSIKKNKPMNIIYISCNPITLARDIVLLSELYAVKSAKFYDNYPGTYHHEVAVKLTLRGRR